MNQMSVLNNPLGVDMLLNKPKTAHPGWFNGCKPSQISLNLI